MQGHLRKEKLSFIVATQCGHCQQPLHIEIDSDLNYRVQEAGAAPLVYTPMVDLHKLEDPSIIDGF